VIFGLLNTDLSLAMPGVHSYEYLSPVPNSRLVQTYNNVLIRHGDAIDAGTLTSDVLTVIGSISGPHTGELFLADDTETIVFNPHQPFEFGETVEVNLSHDVKTEDGKRLPLLAFEFTVMMRPPWWQKPQLPLSCIPGFFEVAGLPIPFYPDASGESVSSADCELPPLYPPFLANIQAEPDPGAVFLAPYRVGSDAAALVILDNLGMPLFYRIEPGAGMVLDFKMQPNGLLTYRSQASQQFMAMDSSYVVVDSFRVGNGYGTDGHDFQLLADGHALLMSYDPQPVRMDSVIPGGRPDAIVVGLIVQELDRNKHVVFQWRSWDHFEITDLVSPYVSLTDSIIDYVHGNSVEMDSDGNLLISSRHMNEITKISRRTGGIIWRLGLHARNNEFTFVNDPRGFSHQHDARRLPNGNITLYDNGNVMEPEYSRALEYQLDEANKIATFEWEQRHSPDVYGPFMGNVQRRPDGGTMIAWGGYTINPKLTDLSADGTTTFEIWLPDRWWTYRAFRFPWRTNRFSIDPGALDFGVVELNKTASLPLFLRNTSQSTVTFNCFLTTHPAFSVETSGPIMLAPGVGTTVDVNFTPTYGGEFTGNLYVREISDTGIIAQAVSLRGENHTVTAVGENGSGLFRLHRNLPNPFRGETTIAFDLPRRDRVVLEVFDIRGRRVQTLVNEIRDAGRHVERWSTEGVPSGLYLYRLHQGERIGTRKLVVLD
jgi:hypothetical protein